MSKSILDAHAAQVFDEAMMQRRTLEQEIYPSREAINALQQGADPERPGERGGEILARVPFGELARPDDSAQMVCWLSSDRARYVSGAVFTVDGAYMAG